MDVNNNSVNFLSSSNFTPSNNSSTEFSSALENWVTNPHSNGDKYEAVRRINEVFKKNATSLDLHGLKLNTLPACLCNLSELEELDLSYNKLISLPSELGNLHKLCDLRFDHNPQLSHLPISLGNIENIHYLMTVGTRISDEFCAEIIQLCREKREANSPKVVQKQARILDGLYECQPDITFKPPITHIEYCILRLKEIFPPK